MKLLIYTILHSLMLITITLYDIQYADIYNVLINHVNNPILHLFHIIFIFLLASLLARFLINFFLQNLNLNEQSQINENLFIFLTDTMFIISIFPDEISIKTFLLFILLCISKSLTWLVVERVTIQKDFKIRIFIFINLIFSIFSFLVYLNYSIIFKSLNFLFSFEYAIIILLLLKSLILTFINDPYHIFLTDIIYTILKLKSLILFFTITAINYRIPFNIFREGISTIRSLFKKIKNYRAYKKILNVLRKCEVVREGVCPICTLEFGSFEEGIFESVPENDLENVNENNSENNSEKVETRKRDLENNKENNKETENYKESENEGVKLSCSHTFHINCLKKWVEQQQVCPVCRDKIIKKKRTSEFYGVPVENV